MPVEYVNLRIVEVLTADYEFEQRTISYKDHISRAEIAVRVIQRCTLMSTSGTKSGNVGQAFVASKPVRRNCKQQGNGRGVSGKGVSGGIAVATIDNHSSTKGGEREFDDMRNKLGARTSMV